VYGQLVEYLEKEDDAILGPNKHNLPKIVRYVPRPASHASFSVLSCNSWRFMICNTLLHVRLRRNCFYTPASYHPMMRLVQRSGSRRGHGLGECWTERPREHSPAAVMSA